MKIDLFSLLDVMWTLLNVKLRDQSFGPPFRVDDGSFLPRENEGYLVSGEQKVTEAFQFRFSFIS